MANDDLPLFNHLIPVGEAGDDVMEGLPVSDQDPHAFVRLHDKTVHMVDGAKTHGIPLGAYLQWLVAHKDDAAAFEAVQLLLHNRGIEVKAEAVKRGETDPAKVLVVHNRKGFVQDSTGINIIPLSLLDVARIFNHHHKGKTKPGQKGRPYGGQYSEDAIAGLENFLVDVIGIKPNHMVIRAKNGNVCAEARP